MKMIFMMCILMSFNRCSKLLKVATQLAHFLPTVSWYANWKTLQKVNIQPKAFE